MILPSQGVHSPHVLPRIRTMIPHPPCISYIKACTTYFTQEVKVTNISTYYTSSSTSVLNLNKIIHGHPYLSKPVM